MPQNAPVFSAFLSPKNTLVSDFREAGNTFFVSTNGSDVNYNGTSRATPYLTIGKAISVASPKDTILIGPGTYAEAVTVPRALSYLTIAGLGPRNGILIQPSATNANALTNNADTVKVLNLRTNANGTGTGFVNTGSRLETDMCKFENTDGTGTSCQLTLDSAGGSATQGGGADVRMRDTEFAWAATGLLISGNNGLAVTQIEVSRCRFHNLATAHIAESTLNSGPAADAWRNLEISDCLFDRMEDGTEPTHYLNLAGSNSNTGIVTRCSFPTAINGGKNTVSTALLWVSNYMTGGVSTGQPS